MCDAARRPDTRRALARASCQRSFGHFVGTTTARHAENMDGAAVKPEAIWSPDDREARHLSEIPTFRPLMPEHYGVFGERSSASGKIRGASAQGCESYEVRCQKFSFSVNCTCRPLLTVLMIFPKVAAANCVPGLSN